MRTGDAVVAGAKAPTLTAAPVGPQAAGGPRSLDELLKDPEIAGRVEEIAKAKRSVPGQLLEESLSEQVRTQLATPEGRKAFNAEAPDAVFVEGYRIRAEDGRQLSDGMILSGTGQRRKLRAGFEGKLS